MKILLAKIQESVDAMVRTAYEQGCKDARQDIITMLLQERHYAAAHVLAFLKSTTVLAIDLLPRELAKEIATGKHLDRINLSSTDQANWLLIDTWMNEKQPTEEEVADVNILADALPGITATALPNTSTSAPVLLGPSAADKPVPLETVRRCR